MLVPIHKATRRHKKEDHNMNNDSRRKNETQDVNYYETVKTRVYLHISLVKRCNPYKEKDKRIRKLSMILSLLALIHIKQFLFNASGKKYTLIQAKHRTTPEMGNFNLAREMGKVEMALNQ
jgi:hypothetical protein